MKLDKEARSAALARLEPFVGEWSMEASLGDAKGTSTFEWTLDGQYLVHRSEIPVEGAPSGLSLIGLDETGAIYTYHYFDSRGVARVYEMTLGEAGTWELLRRKPDFFPLDFSQRYVGTIDGDTIDGRWETSPNGENWELDFGLTYRRVR